LEAFKTQLTLHKQEEWEQDPMWNNILASAQCRHVDENKGQIDSDIAQHHVAESDFNFLKMHLLNHFSDHIHQLGNLITSSSELPEREVIS